MSFSPRIRYLLLSAAVLTASCIQLLRGYPPMIVLVCGLTFLVAGNAMIYLTGASKRAARRQQKRDYWAG